MKLFSSESAYNAKTDQWEDYYKIDGQEVDEDLYFFEMDREKNLETAKLLKKIEIEEDDNPCEGCRCRDCCEAEEEFNYEDLLDIFVEKILDTNGCSIAIKDILDEVINIFLPEDYEDADKCEGNCEECSLYNQEDQTEDQTENQFLRAVTDATNDTLKMFNDPNTCKDCKAHALLDLVMLGVDGALQGCIGKKELLN